MKLDARYTLICAYRVAPLVGAWIETPYVGVHSRTHRVAPLVGAWIETSAIGYNLNPSDVAPLVGAWIETSCHVRMILSRQSRTSCRCVD